MRIKKLLPEIIEGSNINSKSPLGYLYNGIREAANLWENTPLNSNVIDLSDINDPKFNHFITTIGSDKGYMSLVKNFKIYRKKGKDYVVSKEFFKHFREISLEKVQFKHLPTDVHGYIELPETLIDEEGDKLNGLFFSICKISQWYNCDQ